MREIIDPLKKENLASRIIEGENFVPQELFLAYYKGNSMIPQTGDGIRLYSTIYTVLENQNTNWQEFQNCTLSPQQITFLSKAMSDQHKHRGVPISTAEHSSTFVSPPKIIPEKMFQGLWRTVRESTQDLLMNYIYGGFGHNPTRRLVAPVVINTFLHDPQNQKRVEELIKILTVIKASLDKPDVKNLLAQYRKEFRTIHEKNNDVWHDIYKTPFTEMIKADVEAAFEGKLPKNIDYLLSLSPL